MHGYRARFHLPRSLRSGPIQTMRPTPIRKAFQTFHEPAKPLAAALAAVFAPIGSNDGTPGRFIAPDCSPA